MSRKLWLWIGGIALGIAVLGAGGAYAMRDTIAFANIAVTYAAKQTCSCRHVSGRSLESCLAEFPDAAQREQIAITESDDGVRASVLFGAFSAQATYEEGYGCRIVTR